MFNSNGGWSTGLVMKSSRWLKAQNHRISLETDFTYSHYFTSHWLPLESRHHRLISNCPLKRREFLIFSFTRPFVDQKARLDRKTKNYSSEEGWNYLLVNCTIQSQFCSRWWSASDERHKITERQVTGSSSTRREFPSRSFAVLMVKIIIGTVSALHNDAKAKAFCNNKIIDARVRVKLDHYGMNEQCLRRTNTFCLICTDEEHDPLLSDLSSPLQHVRTMECHCNSCT